MVRMGAMRPLSNVSQELHRTFPMAIRLRHMAKSKKGGNNPSRPSSTSRQCQQIVLVNITYAMTKREGDSSHFIGKKESIED